LNTWNTGCDSAWLKTKVHRKPQAQIKAEGCVIGLLQSPKTQIITWFLFHLVLAQKWSDTNWHDLSKRTLKANRIGWSVTKEPFLWMEREEWNVKDCRPTCHHWILYLPSVNGTI